MAQVWPEPTHGGLIGLGEQMKRASEDKSIALKSLLNEGCRKQLNTRGQHKVLSRSLVMATGLLHT